MRRGEEEKQNHLNTDMTQLKKEAVEFSIFCLLYNTLKVWIYYQVNTQASDTWAQSLVSHSLLFK